MQTFLLIAAVHFLALLSPGPDFFLIARASLASGWRAATGVCLGIALANGVFIVAAFSGVTILQKGSPAFLVLQWAGCAYLLYLGWLFMRYAGRSKLVPSAGAAAPRPTATSWWRGAGAGFLSGVLNPKNALFYVSLATLLDTQTSGAIKLAYGLWMFGIVLLWDVLVAATIGNQLVLRRFARALLWLERLSGGMLWLLAAVVLFSTLQQMTSA